MEILQPQVGGGQLSGASIILNYDVKYCSLIIRIYRVYNFFLERAVATLNEKSQQKQIKVGVVLFSAHRPFSFNTTPTNIKLGGERLELYQQKSTVNGGEAGN